MKTKIQFIEDFKEQCAWFINRPITTANLNGMQSIAEELLIKLKENELIDKDVRIVVLPDLANPSHISISLVNPKAGYVEYFAVPKDEP